jgi:putative ABC transport system permease protein
MFRVALAQVRAHKIRAILTGFAVMVAAGFLGGTLIYGDTATAAFYADLARPGLGVDVVARPGDASVLGPSELDAVGRVTGVAHSDGRISTDLALLDRNGRAITNGPTAGAAVSRPDWPGLAPFATVDGRLPDAPGEAALDQDTAGRQGFGLGDTVTVVDRGSQRHSLRIVGIVDFGATAEFQDRSVVVLTGPDLTAYAGADRYAAIVVAAAPHTDIEALRQRIAAALTPGIRVDTGAAWRHEMSVESGKYVDGFQSTLLASALISLAVACLVVYNTFRILIAQRTRDLALLRCAGATRGQVVRLVLGEALAVGSIASVGGVALSIVAANALLVERDARNDIPAYHLVVTARSLALPLVLGLAATVVCALVPAVIASRVPPLAALRHPSEHADASHGRARVVRVLLFILVAAAGLAVLHTGRGRGFGGMTAMLAGAIGVFLALVVVLPVVMRPLTRLVGWLPARLLGPPGRMAAGNAGRNPLRLAVTTTALMVGIAPLTMFAVLLSTAREQSVRELAENFPVDFVVEPTGGASLNSAVMERLRASGLFSTVALTRVGSGQIGGYDGHFSAIAPGMDLSPEVVAGTLKDLGPGRMAISTSIAYPRGIALGDRLNVGAWLDPWPATVVAIYDDSPTEGDALVDWSDLTAHLAGTDRLLLRRADGVTVDAAATTVDAATADQPLAVVTSLAERRQSLTDALNRQLVKFGLLLGVALLIGVFGIGNTLSLSVLERTRELATLRALGLGVRQLRGMLLIEAMLATLVGTVLGVAFGVGFGWLAAYELITAYGHGTPSVPVQQIATYVALAALAGALASVVPARRATRASVVTALADL